MAAVCVVHFDCVDNNAEIKPCTDVSWDIILYFAEKWKELECEQCEVSLTLARWIGEGRTQSESGYHRGCYQKFTDKTKLDRATKRNQPITTQPQPPPGSEKTVRVTRAKLNSKYSHHQPVNSRVSPNLCIICQRERFDVKANGARMKANLTTCQTQGQKLIEMAERQQDENILLHVRTLGDLAAAEVQYHNKCYRNYTRQRKCDPSPLDNPSDLVFEEFCSSVIAGKLYADNQTMTVIELHKMYCEKAEAAGISSSITRRTLKRKIAARFEGLYFAKPKRRNESEVVYFDPEALLNHQACNEDEEDTEDNSQPETFVHPSSVNTELFMTALHLKSKLERCKALYENVCPINSCDISETAVKEAVPSDLFNFLAHATGFSEEPAFGHFVEVESDVVKRKLLAICQDIIFLHSRGRKPTPKHVSLGMALRHWTGSAKVIDLLNGFGHCVSSSYVLEHDTALANAQLEKKNKVTPEGFAKEQFTTLVFDNSDFKEETLSGKDTTHCTSGIIIQRQPAVVTCVSECQRDNESDAANRYQSARRAKAKARCRSVATPVSNLPVYVPQRRKGPDPPPEALDVSSDSWLNIMSLPRILDQLYWLSKLTEVQHQLLPAWTGFNRALQECQVPPVCKVGYLPIIDSSPTNMSTVLAILRRSLQVADELNLQHIVVVFDQAIYAKAQPIRWHEEDFKTRLILRLGEFHTAMAFLSVLGKRFEHSGVNDILIQSEVVAEGSVSGVLTGSFYNRSIRCYKLLAEAFCRLQWQEYIASLALDLQADVIQFAEDLNISFPSEFEDLAFNEKGKEIVMNFNQHKQQRCEANPNYALWDSFVRLVAILQLFIRATREGDFELHLATVRHMMPWFFAYDKQNYARFLTIYWFEMIQLENTHPEVYSAFCNGDFVVQRHADQPFSQSACDLVIEQTVNKESKTGGGLVGITRNKAAVHRWLLARLPRAAITTACCKLAGREDRQGLHSDLDYSRMQRDEDDIRRLMTTITEMANPFTLTHPMLINFFTGALADGTVMADLLAAGEQGEDACSTFIKDRLQTNQVDIFTPVQRQKLKTFQSQHFVGTARVKQKMDSLKTSRNVITRVLLASRVRDVSLKSVMKFSLSDIPHALGNPDGTMVKTDKSKLATTLQTMVQAATVDVEDNMRGKTTIIDGMALLHQIRHIPNTFGELANLILRQIIAVGLQFGSNRFDFVCDLYPPLSIEAQERARRSTFSVRDIHITRPTQEVPIPFSRFIASGFNKEKLVSFLCQEWQAHC